MATGSLVFEISMQRYNKKMRPAKLGLIYAVNLQSIGIFFRFHNAADNCRYFIVRLEQNQTLGILVAKERYCWYSVGGISGLSQLIYKVS